MRLLGNIYIALSMMIAISFAHADTPLTQRPEVREFIQNMVSVHGFDKAQLIITLNQAQFQPKIIESMNKPYEKKTWDIYKTLFLTPQRVQGGMEYWRANQETLAQAEKQFGVPAQVIVATIGVETLYGKHQGTYRVLDALTTLAFDYPKRSAFFTKELREYLLLCKEHGIRATQYLGSYAGAMGKPQFMPSSYRFYALDYAGLGKPDLINEDKDVIGSVANYYSKHGWNIKEPVVQPATIKGRRYKKIQTNTKSAIYEVKQLVASGIKPYVMEDTYPKKGGVVELQTDQGAEYWLAYPNFYVITRYNTSPQYALVVHLLSQQLLSQWKSAQAVNSSAGA